MSAGCDGAGWLLMYDGSACKHCFVRRYRSAKEKKGQQPGFPTGGAPLQDDQFKSFNLNSLKTRINHHNR